MGILEAGVGQGEDLQGGTGCPNRHCRAESSGCHGWATSVALASPLGPGHYSRSHTTPHPQKNPWGTYGAKLRNSSPPWAKLKNRAIHRNWSQLWAKLDLRAAGGHWLATAGRLDR